MITALLGTKFVKQTENIAKRCSTNAQKLGNSSIHENNMKHGILTENAALLWRLWKQEIKNSREGARDAHAWENPLASISSRRGQANLASHFIWQSPNHKSDYNTRNALLQRHKT